MSTNPQVMLSPTRTLRALPTLPTMSMPPQRHQLQPPGRQIHRLASESALRSRESQRKTVRPRAPLAKATFLWIRGELIGKGSYGRVYMGMNITTGDIMAVKQVEIPRSVFEQQDSREREVFEALHSESETLKHLDHTNIVQYLGIEETADFLSIFLEYVPGGTIKACLNNHGPFDENITKSFGKQILTGLEYLHSRGIIHRDLKSENILVQPSGECKISDFGISKTADSPEIHKHTALKGTVFWMAPEVVNARNRGYNSKVDIWSVGCVMLEMWTGARPWDGEEMVPVMINLYESKAPPMPSDLKLSSAALDFRARCFTVDPIERPAAQDLKRHPYLRLPHEWVFPGFVRDRGSRSSADDSSTLRPDEHTVRPFVGPSTDAHTHMHFRRPTLDSLVTDTFFQHRETPPPVPPLPNDAGPSRSRGDAPPIVVVEPARSTPNSARSSEYDSLHRYRSPSEASSTSTRRRRRKKWVVANPDPEGLEARRSSSAYTYMPPPLPPSPPPRALSTSEATLQAEDMTIRGLSDRLGIRFRNMPPSAQSTWLSSEGDSDETDTGIWQVRPGANGTPSLPPPPIPLPPTPTTSPAPALSRSESTWARPASQDVYQNLHRFFPDHDLDQPLDVAPDTASTEDLAGRNMRVRKSIRVIAAEHSRADRLNRRRTMLWDSNIHELPRH
ncbi:kinase-like domain-containing protein [Schizophyllum amplum]|uniref:Kinase-like domain-containing protein n=1 Tax=Schizophyllum amplum TaxID=97359 RepID=A0A550C608_9AGAR|nr:kinase-like domain-containing protein [Auriculariopsis ampla]